MESVSDDSNIVVEDNSVVDARGIGRFIGHVLIMQ
jgi:hypothetical protein